MSAPDDKGIQRAAARELCERIACARMPDYGAAKIGDVACTDLALGFTHPDETLLPFVVGNITRFYAAGVYVRTISSEIPRYIDAWRPVDHARPYVIASATGTPPGMNPRYRSANALSLDLRGHMVGWSEDLADRVSALEPGQTMTVQTLYGPALIAREV